MNFTRGNFGDAMYVLCKTEREKRKEDEIMRTFPLFITCVAVLVFGGTALTTTIHVPADQPTIQAGGVSASAGSEQVDNAVLRMIKRQDQ